MSVEKLKALNDDFLAQTGARKRVFFKTYGCQMNARDSEKLLGIMTEAGYDVAECEAEADVIVYNTCCIRENAENRVYGNLGVLKGLKRQKPELIIAVCGCMTQQEHVIDHMMKRCRHVDIIFGTYNIHKLAELLFRRIETGQRIIDVWSEHGGIVEDVPSVREFPFKASVNITYGCNNFCSYCIVPYVRGRERSRQPGDIISEAEALARDGVIEVTLLGQNVNSYAPETDGQGAFPELLREVNRVQGLERVRFLTSHPKDLSDELISAMADCDRVCKHIHLPVQSGSDSVLKRMNRRYTREHYLGLIEKLRAAMPEVAVTTDIIVGFPGETEEDFQETLDVIRRARFSGAFTFMYSVRTGTPAADMTDQVPQDVVNDRFERMLAVLNPLLLAENQAYVNKTLPVLAEKKGKDGLLTGRTEQGVIVHFRGSEDLLGRIVPVRITDCKTFYLLGSIL